MKKTNKNSWYNRRQGKTMVSSLKKVVDVDNDRCLNCHRCISVCPVKYCNNGKEDTVTINADMCIGCGACINACEHGARIGIDDMKLFFDDLKKNTSTVAIVAPAVATVFPRQYLKLNKWLKSIGVKACFDVSFGAELTVQSYVAHIQKNNPKSVISQPCPALVSYIEIYRPELLPYLAPADSPMMHTMKMVRKFYPMYRASKFVIISPCFAKRREFDEVGIGDYNLTMSSLKKYLTDNSIDLDKFTGEEFDNPPAERAVLFSTPGGLLRTALRWNPALKSRSRKIEGSHVVYSYLDKLENQIGRGNAPLLIDCLNCDLGCNGGPGTGNHDKSPDEVEKYVEERNVEMQTRWKKKSLFNQESFLQRQIKKLLLKYWSDGLYNRKYVNRADNNSIIIPTKTQEKTILTSMYKFTDKDLVNCSACGYNTCEKMAIAIHNNLNKPENCLYYKSKKLEKIMADLQMKSNNQQKVVTEISVSLQHITLSMESVSTATEQIQGSIMDISRSTQNASNLSQDSADLTSSTISIVEILNKTTVDVKKSLDGIINITTQTKLLSLNASIEAVNAGEAGRSFTVVANEIKQLAIETAKTSDKIFANIETMNQQTSDVTDTIKKIGTGISDVNALQFTVASSVEEQAAIIAEIANNMKSVAGELQSISKNLDVVIKSYEMDDPKC